MKKLKNLFNLLNVTELDVEKDTFGSALVKGATNSYVKIALIGGLVHLGIKGYQHFTNKDSQKEGA